MTASRTLLRTTPLLAFALGWLIVCQFASLSIAEESGFLDGLRHSVRDRESPPSKNDDDDDHKRRSRSHCSHFHDCDCDDDDDSLQLLAGYIVGAAVTSPFWGPVVALGDDYDVEGYFPHRPYKGSVDGNLMLFPDLPEVPHTWTARASVEHAESFGDLSSLTGKFLFDTSSRWGIDSEINYRTEEIAGLTDELFTGDLNVVYRFAQSPQVQFRSGIGINWLSDNVDENFGFNFTYAVDFFPAEPWVFSNELDWGRLGDSHLFHLRSTAGVIIHGGEIYIGVDYYDVGPSDTTTLVSGVRIWF